MEVKNSNTNHSVLIVDDNPKNLQILGKFLKDEGLNVEFAMDGETALEWIYQKDFDLILLDIMMPGISGYDVCKKIKGIEEKREIPIIFLTAESDSESVVKGFEQGAADYVTKPFNRLELLARVSTQLKIKTSQEKISQYIVELEEKNKLIACSISYAHHIQDSIFNLNSRISQIIPEHFIFFRPKDVISGDFYWFHILEHGLIAAVLDCTGHGVPAAMMSMMGITLLNEIVRVKKVISPDQILNHLRGKIVESLGQNGIVDGITDGMDGSVIYLNLQQKKLQFSNANSSIYLLRDQKLTRMKGDRMPISQYPIMENFTRRELKLESGDMLYLATDGFVDQFGGKEDKKFSQNAFGRLLLEIYSKNTMEQEKILDQVFDDWKGNLDQIDDVTILGIRI
jgi:phosphoserine phosphatase RsbU/P